MTDLALAFDPIDQSADLCIEDGDLALDRGLGSLALMSLLTDARALPSELDTPTGDLRGWWGDALEGRPLGGKLWTLARAKATEENRRRARDFAAGALNWMVQDGIAERLEVEATRIDGVGSGATLRIDAAIIRGGRRIDLRYDLLWRAMQ
ncbi:MAG: phage GP46 family protein [Pseudomonadota bacterium]